MFLGLYIEAVVFLGLDIESVVFLGLYLESVVFLGLYIEPACSSVWQDPVSRKELIFAASASYLKDRGYVCPHATLVLYGICAWYYLSLYDTAR